MENGKAMQVASADADTWEMIPEVEILQNLPTDLYKNLGSKSWKERVEALQVNIRFFRNPFVLPNCFSLITCRIDNADCTAMLTLRCTFFSSKSHLLVYPNSPLGQKKIVNFHPV